jgi:hypothetical protein
MARSALFLRNPAPSAGWYFAQNDVAQVRKVKTTILRGQVAVHNGEVRIKKGYGKFVKRNKVSGML